MHEESIARIQAQEAALQLDQFTNEAAWQIGSLARSLAVERRYPVGIEVCGVSTVPLFTSLLGGTTPGTIRWLRRKAATVAYFDRSSYGIWLQLQSKGQTLAARHALPDAEFAADGGGFPLRVGNAGFVGSLTISGLDMRADHEFAVEVLCQHLGQNYTNLALPRQD